MTDDAEAPRAQSAATVERAVDVLLCFVNRNSRTLGVTEIATALAMSKAAVHRTLAALRSRGLVEFDDECRRYSLGPTAMALGVSYLAKLDVRRLVLPELRALSTATGETATLSLRMSGSRVYVDQITPGRRAAVAVAIGVPFPLHAGASSKALLACLPEDEVACYLEGYLAPLTAHTITDPVLLRHELTEIRERGWACSRGERQVGAASVAMPIRDRQGEPLAVISVCGPDERFGSSPDEHVHELAATARRLATKLRHRPER
jgi:DNA-binding IclR family transcriptional regulator